VHEHCHVCGGLSSLIFYNTKQKGENMNIKKITTLGLAALLGTGCATMGYAVRQQQEQMSREQVIGALESMTAAGEFSTIAAYVHQQIDQHPDRYMNELYDGAEVALRHAPNGVYGLAIDQYAEDVHEYMETRIYTMQQMQEHGGFSMNYDLNYDE
jgi:hypothetical protein